MEAFRTLTDVFQIISSMYAKFLSIDASSCIDRGGWDSDVARGGVYVVPDYCPGCIIPDEWREV